MSLLSFRQLENVKLASSQHPHLHIKTLCMGQVPLLPHLVPALLMSRLVTESTALVGLKFIGVGAYKVSVRTEILNCMLPRGTLPLS